MTSDIEISFHRFYRKFSPNVYLSGTKPLNPPTPYIVFNIAQPDFLDRTILNFSVFDNATNTIALNRICDMITAEIHPIVGVDIPVYGDNVWEYYNPRDGTWVEFDINDFANMAIWFMNEFPMEMYGVDFETREVENKLTGILTVYRHGAFLQNQSLEEVGWVAKIGTLELASYVEN